jgi:hypothetical protein
VPKEHVEIVAAPGSPVRSGPKTLAQAALLTCAHYLPVGRSRNLLQQLTAIEVSLIIPCKTSTFAKSAACHAKLRAKSRLV